MHENEFPSAEKFQKNIKTNIYTQKLQHMRCSLKFYVLNRFSVIKIKNLFQKTFSQSTWFGHSIVKAYEYDMISFLIHLSDEKKNYFRVLLSP